MTKNQQEIAQDVLTSKAILLDVREKDEWGKGHFSCAMSYPLSLLQKELPQHIAKEIPIYTHCAHGRRAQLAAKLLQKHFDHVYALVYDFHEIEKLFNFTVCTA